MRILIVSAGLFNGQIGGGQSYTQDLALGLKNRGHTVDVLESVPRVSCNDAFKVRLWNNISIWSINMPILGETIADSYEELSSARIQIFTEILNTIKPEYVHINNLMPGMVRACNLLKIKHLVVAHHPGEICPKGDLLNARDEICNLSPSAKNCVPCIFKTKKVRWGFGRILALMPLCFYQIIGTRLSISNPFGYVGRVLYQPWLTVKKINGILTYLKEAQIVIAPSKAVASALMRSGVLEYSRLKVITHGIYKLNHINVSSANGRPLRFGYLGRIDHTKGLHILMVAMKIVNFKAQVELHIYGDATNKAGIKYWNQLKEKYSKEPWLHIHGSFERSSLINVLSKIDVLVLPAIYLEVFGLVVAEALSAGCPVLATACGGPEEQIIDGVNGWIVPPNNAHALAKKILFLVSHPEKVKVASEYTSDIKGHTEYLIELEEIYTCKPNI